MKKRKPLLSSRTLKDKAAGGEGRGESHATRDPIPTFSEKHPGKEREEINTPGAGRTVSAVKLFMEF